MWCNGRGNDGDSGVVEQQRDSDLQAALWCGGARVHLTTKGTHRVRMAGFVSFAIEASIPLACRQREPRNCDPFKANKLAAKLSNLVKAP
ncbi:hypothetical protein E2C01_019169 [Portunus trituberculatus]|uniref:Uncharacterized protein n=1 Tax=Portunus trituberculatus TaxID=210409 RepID=A0A5B7DWW8_PORTR|nr:hypothetical protein [Portunus trituberculatus]